MPSDSLLKFRFANAYRTLALSHRTHSYKLKFLLKFHSSHMPHMNSLLGIILFWETPTQYMGFTPNHLNFFRISHYNHMNHLIG